MKLFKKIVCIAIIFLFAINNISLAANEPDEETAEIIYNYWMWNDETKTEEQMVNKLKELSNNNIDTLKKLQINYGGNEISSAFQKYGIDTNSGWPDWSGANTDNIIYKQVNRAIQNLESGTTNYHDENEQEKDKNKIKEYYNEAYNAGNNVDKIQLKTIDTLLKRYVNLYGQLRNETDQDLIGIAEWVDGKLKEMGVTESTAYNEYHDDHQERQENNEQTSNPSTGVLGQANASSSHTLDEILDEGDNFLSKGDGDKIDASNLKDASNTLYNILLIIGISLAVAIGMYLGIKFMLSSVEDRAKVKESLVPYIAGCIVIFGAFVIWKLAITLLSQIS